MHKMDKQVMVVPREKLLGSEHFEGFSATATDFVARILAHHRYMRRGDAEVNASFKQPICYVAIVNPATKSVFAYERASNDNTGDSRLHGLYSWGFGGHVEPCDAGENPLFASRVRELQEEARGTFGEPRVIGYINDESDAVNQVHFGVLCIIETTGDVALNDPALINGRWVHVSELERLVASKDVRVEAWSRIAVEPLKNYFSR